MKNASHKLMDYLAIRDHSIKELREKLAKNYTPSEIEEALEYAHENNWLLDPVELAEKVADQLSNKLKGFQYIIKYLRGKGLPEVSFNEENEMEKGQLLLEKQNKAQKPYSYEDRIVLHRYLANRGFTREIIGKVLNEKP